MIAGSCGKIGICGNFSVAEFNELLTGGVTTGGGRIRAQPPSPAASESTETEIVNPKSNPVNANWAGSFTVKSIKLRTKLLAESIKIA